MSVHDPHDRRRFLRTAAAALAAARLGASGRASAQSGAPRPAPPAAAQAGWGPLKQVDAGALRVGYAEAGPAGGPAVILLHGWPYDIHSFAEVAPLLAARGYRVIVPFLRGYGTTRFRSDGTPRNAQQSALAVDAVALMDALADREGDHRRIRLGRADGRHRRGALAGALQGAGVRERLPDRQPRGQPDAAAAGGRARSGGTSTTSRRSAAGWATNEPARLHQADLAPRLAEVATSTTPPSSAPPPPSTTRTTWPS